MVGLAVCSASSACCTCIPVVLVIKGGEILQRSPFMLEAVYDEDEKDARKESGWGSRQGSFAA